MEKAAADEVYAKYRCDFVELYLALRLGWSYYDLYLDKFSEKSAYFTKELSVNALKAIEEAEALPGFDNKKKNRKQAVIALQAYNKLITDEWGSFAFYAQKAFGVNTPAELDSAGYAEYKKAFAKDWNATSSFVKKLNDYLAANHDRLVTEGFMPATFPAAFKKLGDDFNKERNVKIVSGNDAETDSNVKIKANNAVYESAMEMFDMGKIIFRYDPVLVKFFTFEHLLNDTRGKKPAGAKGSVFDLATGRPIQNAVVAAVGTDGSFPRKEYSTITNSKGKFDLKMSVGTYKVTVGAEGYTTYVREDLVVKAGANRLVKATLTKTDNTPPE